MPDDSLAAKGAGAWPPLSCTVHAHEHADTGHELKGAGGYMGFTQARSVHTKSKGLPPESLRVPMMVTSHWRIRLLSASASGAGRCGLQGLPTDCHAMATAEGDAVHPMRATCASPEAHRNSCTGQPTVGRLWSTATRL